MKYIVTGGAGFIGSHICKTLVGGGHEVVINDDLSSGRMKNLKGSSTIPTLLSTRKPS